MTDTHDDTPEQDDRDSESQGLACVLVFNANDPSGAGGLTGDVLAMGSCSSRSRLTTTHLMLPMVVGMRHCE